VATRFDISQFSEWRALHLGDGGADLHEHALLLVFRQGRPYFGANGARQPRDDEIRPIVALALEQDVGNRQTEPPMQLRQRRALGDELVAQHGRKYFQDQIIAETDDEVGAGRENMRRGRFQTMAMRDVERDRQPS